VARSSAVVGLDIGSSGVRAVQLTRGRKSGGYVIDRAASVDLPREVLRNGRVTDPAALAKALKRLWRKGHFTTRRVVLGLADSGVLTRQLELPWMPPADFRTALRYQLNDALPVDLSTVELDYHLLGEVQRKDEHDQEVEFNRILIVAASTEAVAEQSQVVRKARLEPVAADSAAFALIRAACAGVVPSDSATQALADIGGDQLTVVIHAAGQPRFIRTVANLGGDTATIAIAERLRVTPDEAEVLKRETGLNGPVPVVAPIAESSVFGRVTATAPTPVDARTAATIEALNPWATTVIGEIRNSLDYFQASDPASPVQSLTLVGRTVELDGMVERISTQIPLPVRVMDPLAGLPASKRVTRAHEADSRLAVAAGLAMRGSA
jgi:type IV pilus assembly protein PilM